MSEEQLNLLIARLQQDPEIRNMLVSAVDLGAAVAIAREEGFDVTPVDWLKYQEKYTLELSNDQLENVAGGGPKEDGCASSFILL